LWFEGAVFSVKTNSKFYLPNLFIEEIDHKIITMRSKHYHDSFEIYSFQGDKVKYFIDDKTYILNKNDLIIIDRYVLHKTADLEGEYKRILIQFRPYYLNDFPGVQTLLTLFTVKSHQINLITPLVAELEDINRCFAKLKANYNRDDDYAIIYNQSLLMQLLIVLNQAWDRQLQTAKEIFSINGNNKLHNIIQYINLNYKEDITLDELAEQFFFSKYHICHLFKDYTGFTIIDYINRKRVVEAETLLRNSQMKIVDIAYKTGFKSITHFIRTFKKITGMTPRQIRKSQS
jgi:AraC-like DNA-binding protein